MGEAVAPALIEGRVGYVLPARGRARMESWAENAAPREACGVLLGRRDSSSLIRVAGVTRAENLAARPDRFELHPTDWVRAEACAKALGLEVLGFWHSHPRTRALLSAHDLQGLPDGYCCAILGLAPGGTRELRVFSSGCSEAGEERVGELAPAVQEIGSGFPHGTTELCS